MKPFGINFFNLWGKSHSPSPCHNSFDCLSVATRITGKGKCPKQYFCPLPADKINTFNMIKEYNQQYQCTDPFKCNCPRGFYCPVSGLKEPLVCVRGTYNAEESKDICSPCTPGYYCPKDGIMSVEQIKLWKCPKGNYCPLGSWQPIQCSVNMYQDEERQSSCKICPDGRECTRQASENSTPCSSGYVCYIDEANKYNRIPCPEGRYCKSETRSVMTWLM
jgi:hypothetical protein